MEQPLAEVVTIQHESSDKDRPRKRLHGINVLHTELRKDIPEPVDDEHGWLE